MGFMDKFQAGLEKVIGPVADKVSNSRHIQAMMQGFMLTIPVTLGVALIAILAGLPIGPWEDFIKGNGLYDTAQEFIALTMSLLAVYVVGAIGYSYTKNQGQSGMIGATLALATFMALQPVQAVDSGIPGYPTSMLLTSNMGADGIFVALVIGLAIPSLYCWLMSKNITVKLPSSVPPMVSTSLAPTFVVMIIFTLVFGIKFGLTQTSYGDLFTLIADVIGAPIQKFGASPVAILSVWTLMSLFWFFGVHPQTILMVYMPVLLMMNQININAFLNDQPLPYLTESIMMACMTVGGTGNTLGLCIATLFARSEKYKALRKVSIPTNLFNINEPVIFGFPIMLNPIYFFPLLLTPLIAGLTAWGLASVFTINLNPTIAMPWVTPAFITAFLQGGLGLFTIVIIAIGIHFVIYLPFFLMDDAKALKEERGEA